MAAKLCKYCGEISTNSQKKHHPNCPNNFKMELQQKLIHIWEKGLKTALNGRQIPKKYKANPVYNLGFKIGEEQKSHKI